MLSDPVGLGALRQSVLLDMRNGYFSNNPLGLWLHVWVSYTPQASTKAGKKALNAIAKKNGRDLDGTPIIATTGDIDTLLKGGYIASTDGPRPRVWARGDFVLSATALSVLP